MVLNVGHILMTEFCQRLNPPPQRMPNYFFTYICTYDMLGLVIKFY